jgi:chitodextrinase
MKRHRHSLGIGFFAFFILILQFGIVYGAPIIPADRMVSWAGNAGVSNGIPDSRLMTIYTNLPPGGDVARALGSCPSDQVVQLLDGTYNINSVVDFQSMGSGKVLRGNGPGKTMIQMNDGYFYIRGQSPYPNIRSNVSVNITKGTNTVYFSALPSWAKVGHIYWISQLDDPAYCSIIGYDPGPVNNHPPIWYACGEDRSMSQLNRCIATTPTSMTFENPMFWNYSTALNAQVEKGFYDDTSLPRRRIGFEGFTITGNYTDTSADFFRFESADSCWISNVVMNNMPGRNGIHFDFSYRITIDHCYIGYSHAYSAGQGYGAGLYNGTTGVLIQNSIFDHLHIGVDFSFSAAGNVVAYNYFQQGFSDSGQSPAIASHGCHNWMNLYEGNYAVEKMTGDVTHGSGSHATVFRNRINGHGASNGRTPIILQHYNRYANVVGNILGEFGSTTAYVSGYSGWPLGCSASQVVMEFGCPGASEPGDSKSAISALLALNTVFTNSAGALVTEGFSMADLTDSYYLSGKPSWFGDRPFPPFDPTKASSAAATNLPAGFRYVFGVDPPVGGPDTIPPNSPPALAASPAGTNQIALSWAPATDNVGVTGYLIERQSPGSSSFTQVATASGTSFTNTGLLAGTNYSYRTRATDAAGNLSSYSPVATAATLPVDTQPPTAPASLTATGASSTQVNLSWSASTDNRGVAKYQVERSQGAGSASYLQVATPSATTFSDSGLSASTVYNYRVRASDTNGNLSGYSTVATATTANPPPDSTSPTVPTGLVASAASSNQINLTWTASSDNIGVTGYRIERSEGSGATNFAQVGTSVGTSFSSGGLLVGTVYNYRVRATDAAGNLSGYSSIASSTTPRPEVGLVAAYGFEEGTGSSASDISANGNHGIINGATWTTGKFGKALLFNGAGSMVTINDSASLDLTTAMTLEAWVYPTALSTSWSDIIYKDPDGYFLMGTTPQAQAPDFGGSFASANVYGTKLPLNTWSHLAGSYDGTTMSFYLNGAIVSSRAQTGSVLVSAGSLFIGGDTASGQYWTGRIDEVRIYNRALSASEIQLDANNPVTGSRPAAPTGLTTAP